MPVARLLAMHIHAARRRLTAWRSQSDIHMPAPRANAVPAGTHPAATLDSRPEVDATSRHLRTSLDAADWAQQRLRLALEANRMAALDYDVPADRFCLSEAADVRGKALAALTGSMAEFIARVFSDDRPRVE